MEEKPGITYAEILQDPSAVYEFPDEVLVDETLSPDQKEEVLLQWKYDSILIDEAADENMCGGEGSNLDQVLRCLNQLHQYEDVFHS